MITSLLAAWLCTRQWLFCSSIARIHFHLVIATRSDPPLPLARLRARGQTVELRAADLSFTEPEAAQFLNDVMGLCLDCRIGRGARRAYRRLDCRLADGGALHARS